MDQPEEHWRKIRESPEFGNLFENIKTQPLAYERVPILEERIRKLEKENKELRSKLDVAS